MRSIWKGRLGFGLVGFQAKLYKATEKAETPMHLLHGECGGGRISYLYKCQRCEAVLASRGELKKGVEVAEGQYVVISDQDLATLPLRSVQEIEVMGFTKDALDPRVVAETYYLAPDKGGEKAFYLLSEAMHKTAVVGIGKLTYREREHLCVVRPFNGVMLLQTLVYQEEIRDFHEISAKTPVTLSEKEMQLGDQFIAQNTMTFDHSIFKNEYQQALASLVESKLKGLPMPAAAAPKSSEGDLVAQLLASVGGVK